MSEKSSYGQILKASSIMGGAAGISMLFSMVRVKFAAVLIGATGVGLNASFVAMQGFVGTVAGLGLQSSAVREIAAAVGAGDQQAIGRAVLTLRRLCWFSGLVGMAAMMLLSPLLSQLTFGHRDYAPDIAALGLVILFANISGGQMALIQGTRRIGDLARINIIGAALGAVAAIAFYATLGLRGIVPTLVTVAATQLAVSWFYARRVPVPKVELSLRQTFAEAGDMVRLGLVMMSSGLMGSAVTYIAIIIGTFNVMEGARANKVKHLLMASTSSVYGANTEMPFAETQKADTPMSFYAATKKATEAMGHSYAHIFGLPVTMFRFFTVYGPWGRPDMALFKFAKNTLEGKPIDIYNHGAMWRDFTYVADLVRGIALLIDAVPPSPAKEGDAVIPQHVEPGDSLSPVAPWRVVNIGNSEKVRLLDYIEALEDALGKKAVRNYMPMQAGDVPATWADANLLQHLTGYKPQTGFREGVQKFVQWYREFYKV